MLFNKNQNGTTEVRSLTSHLGRHDFNFIAPSIMLSEQQLKSAIGNSTYAQLETHYHSDNYKQEHNPLITLDNAVTFAQGTLINLAYMRNIAKDAIIYDNSGIKVLWSEEQRPATAQQLDTLRTAMHEDAYGYLQLLVEMLDSDHTTFADWHRQRGLMIADLVVASRYDYEKYASLDGSDAKFYASIPWLRTVQETELANAFGGVDNPEYIGLLDFVADREITPPALPYAQLLPVAQQAIVHIAHAQGIRNLAPTTSLLERLRVLQATENAHDKRGRDALGLLVQLIANAKADSTLEIEDAKINHASKTYGYTYNTFWL